VLEHPPGKRAALALERPDEAERIVRSDRPDRFEQRARVGGVEPPFAECGAEVVVHALEHRGADERVDQHGVGGGVVGHAEPGGEYVRGAANVAGREPGAGVGGEESARMSER